VLLADAARAGVVGSLLEGLSVRLTWGRTVMLRYADASAHFIESVIANGIILEQAAQGTDRFGYPVTPTDDDPVRERLGEGPGLVLDDVLT
jgi:hypothetical protein